MPNSFDIAPVLMLSLIGLTLAGRSAADQTISIPAVQDSFVREQDPTSNFGGAGLLSVAGVSSVNGLGQSRGRFDTVIKFNAASAVSTFDTTFGAGQWLITGVVLQLSENAAPENSLFPQGVGTFEVSWLSDDSWLEGAGTPISPGHGPGEITWDLLQSILTSAVEGSLDTFSNFGADGIRQYSLVLDDVFLGDVMSGGIVDLHLTPQSSGLGFNFNSRNFGNAALRPQLFVTAARLGDMNCDGVVDMLDVDAFTLALLDPQGYAAAYPSCHIASADLNRDGAVNGGDIQGFLHAL